MHTGIDCVVVLCFSWPRDAGYLQLLHVHYVAAFLLTYFYYYYYNLHWELIHMMMLEYTHNIIYVHNLLYKRSEKEKRQLMLSLKYKAKIAIVIAP